MVFSGLMVCLEINNIFFYFIIFYVKFYYFYKIIIYLYLVKFIVKGVVL